MIRRPPRPSGALRSAAFAGLCVAVGGFAPPALTAQGPPPDLVPLELVRGLLAEGATDEVTVGQVPSALRGALDFDRLGRVVGGMAQTRGSAVVVVAASGTVAEAEATLAATLESAGWRRRTNPAPRPGGFAPQAEPRMPGIWCGPDHVVYPVVRDGGDGALLRLQFEAGERSVCDPQVQEMMEARRRVVSIERFQLPRLVAPEGVAMDGMGVSSGSDHVRSEAGLSSEAPPTELAAHFAAQLEAAGWTESGRSDGAAMAVRRWSVPAPAADAGEGETEPWVGLLVVWRTGEGRLHAELSKRSREPLRRQDVMQTGF